MKKAIIVALSVAAAGCSSQNQVSSQTMAQAVAPLSCTRKVQCDAWWQRAQVWISEHSAYRIATITDSVIQTEGPSVTRRDLAYVITKTPNNDGSATIGFSAQCSNMLGCLPNPWEAGANFKQFIRYGRAMQPATHSDTPGASAAAPIRTAPATPVLPPPPMPAAPPAAWGAPDAGLPTRTIQ
ncbi:hypothetical protein [Mycetohabitans sp. B46]|uniref:hypothetical protein n=1 Tax=Mycetohabitans sp. B46 TaxID=2772536 RepID=UPI00307CE5DA